MRNDKFYQLLVSKMKENTVVSPQSVGRLTPFYKRVVPQFKYYPWKIAVIISIFASVFLYFLLGSILIKIASILQFGF